MPMMKYGTLLLLLILSLAAPQATAAKSLLASPSVPAAEALTSRALVGSSPTAFAPPLLRLSITNAAPTPATRSIDRRTRFEPALYKQLLAASDDETIRGIVWMREQADLSHLPLSTTDRLASRLTVIDHLQSTAERTQQSTRAILQQAAHEGRVTAYRPLWIVNAIAVQGTRQVFQELAEQPQVLLIRQDQMYRLPDGGQGTGGFSQQDEVQWNVKRIQADRVWEALGVTGDGVVVANLDSGVDWQHPDLTTSYRGYTGKPFPTHTGNWYCATDEGYTYPGDGQGHGTHTMGTIVGQNGIGVAPGARWIAAKVFNNRGVALESWIHDGFQWVLAPAGNPALAPDVVNSSWGDRRGSLETFLPDVLALRAGGILPIFSAGNTGPDPETIWSPASLGPTLAVGATDKDDHIALFSSRGPSPWGEIKPEISAPGVHILSAVPGGARAEKDGTSMAAPHVAGVVALMRQVNPALDSDEAETILIETAQPLGERHPNSEYGWGLVNAYAAVSWAGSFGRINGRVTDISNGTLVAQAAVRAVSHGSQFTATATTDASGRYSIRLGAGRYDLTVTGFGYHANAVYGLEVAAGSTTYQDIFLAPLPTGTLRGRVTETDTGTPLGASVYVPGAPPTTTAKPSDGSYVLTLPQGTHIVRAEVAAHRYTTATVVVSPGETAARDFALERSPTILLVDSGAWYNDSHRTFYESALEAQRYLYDLHVIANLHISPTDVPDADDLRPYDLVLWSSPQDAPGYIGAGDALVGYLDSGGRLFLSGQDIAFWDGGGSQSSYANYLGDYLKATYVADNAPSRTLTGQGPLFAGLAITITGDGGADNQTYPDVIAVRAASVSEEGLAESTWTYQGGGSGGQSIGPCLPYRAIYLAFGLEGVNNSADRQEIVQRSIVWLMAPPQPAGIEMRGDETPQVGRAGEQVIHAIRMRNLSERAVDAVTLNAQGHTWPTTFLNPMPVLLKACQATTISVTVDIPIDTEWHAYDTSSIRAYSTLSPSIQAESVVTSKTPAPVLLVNGERFYQVRERYDRALREASIAYDDFSIQRDRSRTLPTSDTLAMYPVVVWYTGYDWYDPLNEAAERAVLSYLQEGGRFLLSSQDYLYYGQQGPLARDYLGVQGYHEGVSSTVTAGETFHPIGWGLGPYPLEYPYPNWSDALIPARDAQIVFRGQHTRPIGLAYRPDPSTAERWRTAFLAFPFETFPESAAPEIIQRTIGWLSWLGASTWGTGRPAMSTGQPYWVRTVSSGSLVTMTSVVRNDGPATISTARFSTTLPAEVSLVPDSLSPWAVFVPAARQISWEDTLDRDQEVQIDFCVRVDDPLADGTAIDFPASLGYDEHALSFELPFVLRVNAPDLSSSTLSVDPAIAPPSSTLTFTLTVRNTGVRDAMATVTATAPSHSVFTGTLDSQGIGTGTILSQTFAWEGPVQASRHVTLRYHMTSGEADGDWLAHQTHVRDQFDEHWPIEALAYIRFHKAYLPLAYRPDVGVSAATESRADRLPAQRNE